MFAVPVRDIYTEQATYAQRNLGAESDSHLHLPVELSGDSI